MNKQELIATAKAMVAESKGLQAMDESTPTCNKRFSARRGEYTAAMEETGT